MSIQITDPHLIQRIRHLARRQRREPQEIIADAVAFYEMQPTSSFLLSIADLGASHQGDIAEHDEEILAAEVHPLTGWGTRSDDDAA